MADDKAVYQYVPDMVRFYLGEEPIIGQVETYICARDDDCRYVLDHLERLVVKAVDASGDTGCSWARPRPAPSGRSSRAGSETTRAVISPSRVSSCRRVRPGPEAESRRGGSICGRTS